MKTVNTTHENYNTFQGFAATISQGRNPEYRTIANNTVARYRDDDTIVIELHGNPIITYHRDGRVELSSCGWYTVTTKQRLNQFSPVYVYQEDYEWFVTESYNDAAYEFKDGMILEPIS